MKKEVTIKKKASRLAKSIYAASASAAIATSMFTTTAFADGGFGINNSGGNAGADGGFGGESVSINNSGGNAGDLMGKVIGVLLTITRFVGVALIVYGLYEVVQSFMQNQPEAKTKGIIMALAGIACTALKSVLVGLGVISG